MNAEEIDAANEFRSENWADCPRMAEYLEMALEHINFQVKQIAALKTALIDRDLRLLEECNGECGKNDIKPEDCDLCEYDYVISQLARELPEIDWSDVE